MQQIEVMLDIVEKYYEESCIPFYPGVYIIYRVSHEECARLREGVPYVKVYRYNHKTPMSKFERLRR